MKDNIHAVLDTIYKRNQDLGLVEDERDYAVRELLGDDLFAKMADLLEEYKAKEQEIKDDIEELTNLAKQMVSKAGTTVKGTYIQAVYTSPRITWDSKGLEGFMVAHPEIKSFQKIGAPSVTLRRL